MLVAMWSQNILETLFCNKTKFRELVDLVKNQGIDLVRFDNYFNVKYSEKFESKYW